MKNSAYWKERFEKLEDEQYRKTEKYYKDIEKQFHMAKNNLQADIEKWYWRLADNNDISYAAAKKLLKKDELEEFHWTVEEYIKYGKENAIDQRWMKELENVSSKVHIQKLEAIQIQTQQAAELLFQEYNGQTADFLKGSYADNFYHIAFEMAKGSGIGNYIERLDPNMIDKIIRKPWAQDGSNFSDRIWKNKEKLVNTLHTELSQCIIRGENPINAAQRVAKAMDVSLRQAKTLVFTESAAISSAARKDCLESLGVEKYEIVATLDSKTSEICREMDGKVCDMKDYQVGVTAPPFHPNCRSCTCPYFDDEFIEGEQRAARDEETGKIYYVPADMKYSEWKEIFVDGNVVKDIFRLFTNNNIKNPHYYDFKKKSIEQVEKEIRQLPYEVGVVFDNNGKAIFCQVQEADEHEIEFTGIQLLKMSGVNLTHNHPFSTPPSPEDLYLLKNHKLNSLRACGKNGTYVIRYSKEIEKLPKYDIFNQEYVAMYNSMFGDYYQKIQKGQLTGQEAERLLQEEIWQFMKGKYGIDFQWIGVD